MALFQASRRVLRPVSSNFARFCSVGTQQTAPTSQGATPAAKKHQFELGPANALKDLPQQGWQFPTTVADSKVPNAGHGRFAAELIKAGSVAIRKPLVPMATIDSLLGLPNDVTVTFSNVADLEKYIDLATSEGGYSREEVLHVFQHFIYGFSKKVCCLNVCTWTVNHGESTGVGFLDVTEQTLPGGGIALVGEAPTDIQVGEELYMDYRKFVIADFYTEYSQKHGFKDVRTATVEAVYGVE